MAQDYPDSPGGSSSSQLSDLPDADKVVILYASETGNAQDLAERVGREFRRKGRRCTVMGMDMFDVFELPHTPNLVLLPSTHGRGAPPTSMLPLWTALLRANLPPDILEDVTFSIYGLGDSSYERFCYAAKILARRVESLGGRCAAERWGDERAPDGYEETFLPWLKDTVQLFGAQVDREEEEEERWEQWDLPEAIFQVDEWEGDDGDQVKMDQLRIVNGTGSGRANGNGNGGADGQGPIEPAPERVSDAARGVGGWTKPDDWVWARLTKNKRVTQQDWWQDVREIELEFEDHELAPYPPGAIANLQPQSSKEEVDEFLEMMHLRDQADRPICVSSRLPDQPLPPHLPPNDCPTTLRSLLTNHLDLRHSPRKSFFEWLRRLTPDERERERLDEFLADPDEIHTYATRPCRTLVETLADFRETHLPLSHLLEIIPPLRRRQFSIASSSHAHPGKVQLLIALVSYKTNLVVPRRGLCSSWLEDVEVGTRLPIKISAPTLYLPEKKGKPVILVGPGTGVAPMRAFLEERVRQGEAKNTILYFGCRSKNSDLYYAAEWEAYRQLGARVEIAASRDQEDKVYVQHLIRRDASLVREWVQEREGWIYISGSSNAMPKEVREAVAWCLSSEGGGKMSEDEAREYVEDMFEQGRGGEESW